MRLEPCLNMLESYRFLERLKIGLSSQIIVQVIPYLGPKITNNTYNTRNKVNLRLPCVKRKWGKQRTAYHAVNDFNSPSEMIRDCSNVNIFKR